MSSGPDYYGVLGVLPSAEEVVIRAAYRALALRYHPDQWRGNKDIAEAFMRELNAAYEILSNPQRRREYDKSRGQSGYQEYQGEESYARSAFTSDERVQSDAWQLALEYFPDLDQIFSRLQTTSARLAISYRATLLETKRFGEREQLAHELEAHFLQSYFGRNESLNNFARELIAGGHQDAARELNRVISVLGDGAPHAIIARIKAKYILRGQALEAQKQLARKVSEYRYVDDATKLVEGLGGEVKEIDRFLGPLEIHVNCQNLVGVFRTHDKMVEWVILNIVPIVLKAQAH